ncbi:MAG: DUF3971 domain-containing protein [Gammaproteobacteria bacterium]|nr:DUF3971 domain-containing protein [Gammaproteobacteria bacterium]
MATLARTALLLVTVLAVVFALMQGGGRLFFAKIHEFEDRVNAHLAKTGVAVEGLAGSWRHLNPSVSATTVTFGGGELKGLDVELDVLESLWRNRLVARRLRVESALLRFVRTRSGWRLDGEAGDTELGEFLKHSDEVSFAGLLELAGYSATGTVRAEVEATNRGDRHRWRAIVVPESGSPRVNNGGGAPGEECGCVFVDLDMTDVGGTVPAGNARFLVDDVSLAGELAQALALPDVLLAVDGKWTGDGSSAAAVADARVSGGEAGPLTAVGTTVARSVGRDGAYRGVSSLQVTAGDAFLDLEGIGVSADAAGVGFWFAGVDIAVLNSLLAAGLGPHGHWFEGVAAEGRLGAVRAHLSERGLAYEARLDSLSMSNYQGVPELANGCGHLRGHLQGFRVDFRCEALRFGLPRHFDNPWDYDAGSGDVTFWFEPGYLGVRGNVQVALGTAAAGGGFSLTRPRDSFDGQFVLLGLADGLPAGVIKRHLPQGLGRDLKAWLRSSLVDGQLNSASAAFHGHTQTRPGLPNRRFEVTGLVVDGTVDYHVDWPPAEGLHGSVTITGEEARGRVAEGVLFGGEIRDSDIRVPLRGGYVDMTLHARAAAARALEFVRTTPLAEELHFVSESWRADGALGIDGDLRIPIDDASGPADLDLGFEVDDVTLDLVDLKLLFGGLNGNARFQSPHHFSSSGLEGSLFGFPVEISAAASEEANILDFRGTGAVADVYRILETHEFPLAAGVFGFDARLRAFADPSRALELDVDSDGVGIAVNLPPPLHKSATQPGRVDVEMVFDDDYTRAVVRGEAFEGWLHLRDDVLARGSIGIGVPPGPQDITSSHVRLSGHLETIRLEGEASELLPETVPWRLDRLSAGSVWLRDIELTAVALNGIVGKDGFAIGIDSNEVRGTVVLEGEEPVLLSLDEVRVSGEESDGDLLDVSILDQVPAADVTIARVLLGDDDYGAWAFGVRPDDGVIRLTGLVGHIKGMQIEAEDDLVWAGESDASLFRGRVTASDLALVLPQWDYAPSVESTSVSIEAAVEWPGSPLNFELGELTGSMGMAIETGRFLEVDEAAGARILSLLNFANIARRLQLDFSDVFDKGIGFDHVRANGELHRGVLSFTEPMEIHGPGSDFRINGTVDLADGALDNEMIVTLPLSSNLPWYAWLATAEPVTAVGVLVGSEIFKEQIQTLSSARYRITGTIEDPNLEFVDIFRSEMDRPGEEE